MAYPDSNTALDKFQSSISIWDEAWASSMFDSFRGTLMRQGYHTPHKECLTLFDYKRWMRTLWRNRRKARQTELVIKTLQT